MIHLNKQQIKSIAKKTNMSPIKIKQILKVTKECTVQKNTEMLTLSLFVLACGVAGIVLAIVAGLCFGLNVAIFALILAILLILCALGIAICNKNKKQTWRDFWRNYCYRFWHDKA